MPYVISIVGLLNDRLITERDLSGDGRRWLRIGTLELVSCVLFANAADTSVPNAPSSRNRVGFEAREKWLMSTPNGRFMCMGSVIKVELDGQALLVQHRARRIVGNEEMLSENL
jgi:hypothetical protein